jgi:hypothetical protein
MVYSDGIFISIITKIRQQLQHNSKRFECFRQGLAFDERSPVRITPNQIIGFILVGVANMLILLVLKSLSITVCGFYILASVAEHLILESANQRISSQWSIFNLKGIVSEAEPEKTPTGDDE